MFDKLLNNFLSRIAVQQLPKRCRNSFDVFWKVRRLGYEQSVTERGRL